MTPPIRPTAAYSRVSTTIQATDGVSLEEQTQSIREHCARMGWGEPILYVDAGRSAYKETERARPEFARLMADAEVGAIGRIVVWHLNRWSRRVRVTLDTIERLERAGVSLLSLSQQVDYTSAMGRFIVTMFAGVAQLESDEKSEGAIRRWAELRSQGKWGGGRPPFGARRGEDGRLTLDPDKEPTLARALELAAQHTRYGAAEILSAEGWPPPSTYRKSARLPSGKWHARSVGLLIEKGAWLLTQPEPWPSRYLAALMRPKAPPVVRTRITRPLTGLMRCDACGNAVVYSYNNQRKKARARCETPGCRREYGNADRHEDAVLAAAMALRPREEAEKRPGIDIAELEAIREQRRVVVQMRMDWQRSGMRQEDYEREMASLDVREAAVVREGGGVRDFAGIAAILPDFNTLAPAEMNRYYRELIARVVMLDKDDRRIDWMPATMAEFDGWR